MKRIPSIKAPFSFLKHHPDTVAIGLSATAFTKGLGNVFSHVVNSTTTDQLIADGWLVPLKAFAASASA